MTRPTSLSVIQLFLTLLCINLGISSFTWARTLPSEQRSLAIGDFDDFNQVLEDAEFELPNMGGKDGSTELRLSSIRCKSLSIGDAQVTSQKRNSRAVDVSIQVVDLDMVCRAGYYYSGRIVSGRGDVRIVSRGNDVQVDSAVSTTSPNTNLDWAPPTEIEILRCNPHVNINDIDFDGGMLGWILNLVEGLARGIMEDLVEDLLCNELAKALANAEEMLRASKQALDQYASAVTLDPLQSQNAMQVPSNINLLNLRDQQTEFGHWVNDGFNHAVDFLSSVSLDPNTGRNDLKANMLIRDYLLTDGVLQVDINNMFQNGLLFYSHDALMETTIRVNNVKLMGLDSLVQFDPLATIGDYTVQNQVGWRYLAFVVDATIEIEPSTLENSVVNTPANTRIFEEVSVVVGMHDLQADVSLLAAVNQDLFESIKLGSLFKKDNVIPCLLSAFFDVEVSAISLQTSDILTPNLNGFVSVGLDRLFNNIMDTAFLMYENLLLNRSPSFIQTEMRPLVNDRFLGDYLDTVTSSCASFTSQTDSLVDLRDLLLHPEDALRAGGTGREPYGDLFSSYVAPSLETQVMQVDKFNEVFVRTATKRQSGVEGTLSLPRTIVDYRHPEPNSLFDFAQLQVSQLRIENLDTITDPLNLMDPRDHNLLFNTISLDDSSRPLKVSVNVKLEVGGSSSPFKMDNEIDFSLTLPSATFSLGVLANMKEGSLLNFPVGDTTNPYCWLATLGSDPNTGGESTSPKVGRSRSWVRHLDLDSVSMFVSTFYMDAQCVSCSSPGALLVPEVLSEFTQFGFQYHFKDRILELIDDMMWGAWRGYNIEQILEYAPKLCPHRDEYDPDATHPTLEWPSLSTLSPDSIETSLAMAVVLMQTAMVVSAKNHLLVAERWNGVSFPDSPFPEHATIVDFTDLSSEMGEWADFGFTELRKWLLEPVVLDSRRRVQEDTVRVHSLLREFVLDDNGAYSVSFENVGVESLGLAMDLDRIQIYGLDSISGLDLLNPTAPQILQNQFQFSTLSFVVHTNVTVDGRTQTIPYTYNVHNVVLKLDLLLALDLSRLREIQLGSLFNMYKIFSCLVSGVHQVQIDDLRATVGSMEDPKVEGFFTVDTKSSIDWILESMLDEYRDDVLAATPLFLETTLRDVVNALLPTVVESIGSNCPIATTYPTNGLVDFRSLLLEPSLAALYGGSGEAPYGNLFRMLYGMLDEHVLQTGATSRPLVNDIFRHVTTAQSNISGTFALEGDSLDSHTSLQIAGLNAVLGLAVSNLTIEHVDSVGDPLQIAVPVLGKANIVENTVSFGVDSRPLTMSATFSFSLSDGEDMNIRNEMDLVFSLEDVVVMAEVLLKISENSFASFPIRDLNNIHCWLATILSQPAEEGPAFRGIGLQEGSFSIGNFSLDLQCASCTSPQFDKLLLSLYHFQNTTDLESTLREQVDTLFGTDFFPVFLDEVVKDASKKCPHHPHYDPNATDFSFLTSPASTLGFLDIASSNQKPSYFNVANATIAGLIFLLGVTSRYFVKRRNKKWTESLSREGKFLLRRQEDKDRRMQGVLDASTTSLFTSPHIPKRVRYGVVVAILGNIGLYLGAHLCTLSSVNLDASVAGEEFTIHEFIEFSFIESTWNTFQNGGAEMAVLLWIFTGIWPYIKLVLSLLVWVLPPTRLSVAQRGRALLWIDALARLSVIDIFTVLLGFAILLVFVGGPDESLNTETAMYTLKAIIVPRAGFYCIIIAQRMSRVSSRFFLEYHEQVIDLATEAHRQQQNIKDDDSASQTRADIEEDDDDSEVRSLMQRIDEVAARVYGEEEANSNDSYDDECAPAHDEAGKEQTEDDESGERFKWGTLGVIFGAVTIFIVFVIGCIFAPSISLDTSSVAGLAVESGKTYEAIADEYGVFLVVSSILVKARFDLDTKADYVGFGLLTIGGMLSIAVVFFVQAYQFIKRKLKERQQGPKAPLYGHRGCGLPFYFRLYQWKHMEVYLISVAIGVWQLGSVCSYAIHLYCDILRQIYAVMAYIGLIEETTAQCSRVQAASPGNFIIIVGAFLMLLLTFVFQIAGQYRKNIADALRWIDDEDFPRLSLAWSKDKSKNSRYSHLTASLSTDRFSDEDDALLDGPPGTPHTFASTPPGTPASRGYQDPELVASLDVSPSRSSLRSSISCRQTPPRNICIEAPHRVSSGQRRTSSVRFEDDSASDSTPPSPPRLIPREASSSSNVLPISYRPTDVDFS